MNEDDREALARAILGYDLRDLNEPTLDDRLGWMDSLAMADRVLAAGFRRLPVTEPSTSGVYIDRLGNVWRKYNDGVFFMPGTPDADPEQYGPFYKMVVEPTEDASSAIEAAALYPFNGTDPGIVMALRSAYRAGADREARAALVAAREAGQ